MFIYLFIYYYVLEQPSFFGIIPRFVGQKPISFSPVSIAKGLKKSLAADAAIPASL